VRNKISFCGETLSKAGPLSDPAFLSFYPQITQIFADFCGDGRANRPPYWIGILICFTTVFLHQPVVILVGTNTDPLYCIARLMSNRAVVIPDVHGKSSAVPTRKFLELYRRMLMVFTP
jgi:hypothetical protein